MALRNGVADSLPFLALEDDDYQVALAVVLKADQLRLEEYRDRDKGLAQAIGAQVARRLARVLR